METGLTQVKGKRRRLLLGGLTQEHVLRMVEIAEKVDPSDGPNALWKKMRNLIILRLLYETFARVGELVKVDLDDVEFHKDGGSIYIRHPKRKAIVKDGKVVEVREEPRFSFFSERTKNLILQYLGGRRKGPLLTSSCNTEGRITTRQVGNIISIIGIGAKLGRRVSPKDLREAGERHTDVAGADTDTTSLLAGHTRSVKEAHYKRLTTQDLQAVLKRHHPFF